MNAENSTRYVNKAGDSEHSYADLSLFDFRSILEKIHARCADQAYTKGLELFINFDNKLPDKLISEPNKIEQIFTSLTLYTLEATPHGYIEIKVCLNMSDYDSIEVKCLIEGKQTMPSAQIPQPHKEPQQFHSTPQPIHTSVIQTLIESLGGKLYSPHSHDGSITFWFTFRCNYSDQEPNYLSYNFINQTLYFVDTCSLSKEIYIKLLDSIGFKVIDAGNPDKIGELSNERDILVYSIDARFQSPADFGNLLDVYRNKKIRKFAFISSYDPRLHEPLINIGFDHVIPKTINRKQLVNYFSTSSDSMLPKQRRGNPSKSETHYPPRVLIVDDNEINVKILEAYLKPLNVETATATNGEHALQKLEENTIDLIFMDLHMPIMNGYQTTETIRALEGPNATIPIIGITADGLQESIQRCLRSGMNQCLVKPVTHKDIEEILNAWVFQEHLSSVNIPKNLDELTNMMLSELPGYKKQLQKAIRQNNLLLVYEIAHRIAGGCAYCNMPELRRTSLNLQTAAKSHNKVFIEKSTKQLLQTIEGILNQSRN